MTGWGFFTYAVTWASTKRHVGIWMSGPNVFSRKAIRIELFWIWELLWIAMQCVRNDGYGGASRNDVTILWWKISLKCLKITWKSKVFNSRILASSQRVLPYIATLGNILRASLMHDSRYFNWRMSAMAIGRSDVPKIRLSSSDTRSWTSGWLPIK